MPKSIYTIPPGYPFARCLARGLLDRVRGEPEALARMRILLPTRRACRALRTAFLQESAGQALILPRMHPLGDIDEDEFLFFGAELESFQTGEGDTRIGVMPEAISPLRRQILLTRLIAASRERAGGQAAYLARTLASLVDEVQTEDLDFAALDGLAGEEFARHWQITLDVLKIVTEHWPPILAEFGAIDPARRRIMLLRAQAEAWRKIPPDAPVIAAGSTGSIPATGDLLSVIADLPQGEVILPGFDSDLDAEDWDGMTPTHPQYALKGWLEKTGCARRDVRIWPGLEASAPPGPAVAARQGWIREVMRPAVTQYRWQEASERLDPAGLRDLTWVEAGDEEEEAAAIAFVMRRNLENPGYTTALITPDRALARRVQARLRRWDLEVDDSAGITLAETQIGRLARLCQEVAAAPGRPVALLALLRHGMCAMGENPGSFRHKLGHLEKHILRGPAPAPEWAGLKAHIAAAVESGPDNGGASEELGSWALKLVERLEKPAAELSRADLSFQARLQICLEMMEDLAASDTENGAERLWHGEIGEKAAAWWAELLQYAGDGPACDFQAFREICEAWMEDVPIRPSTGTHPRLSIFSPLEARMVQADCLILGGLNEGTWPQDQKFDPWMSRPMREAFGLRSLEFRVGQAAHDFAEAFCAPRVVLTRACRQDGVEALKSRFLTRFDAVLRAAGAADDPREAGREILQVLRLMDTPEGPVRPCSRPAPTPPVMARPLRFSATSLEMLIRDPYAFYAKAILSLKPLPPLEEEPQAAQRGQILHSVLEKFVRRYPDTMPAQGEARAELRSLLEAEVQEAGLDPSVWRAWRPRMEEALNWFAGVQDEWRAQHVTHAVEIRAERECPLPSGRMAVLHAKADRIDRDCRDGGLVILDYKTGTPPSKKAVAQGLVPQLPLEGLIFRQIFKQSGDEAVNGLGYWHLSGSGHMPGAVKMVTGPAMAEETAELLAVAEEGIRDVLNQFETQDMPYLSLPDPAAAPPVAHQDYAHLARVAEWGVQADQDTEEGAAA